MSIIIVATLWIFLAVLGGYAFYRQVRAHLELGRSLHALKNANDLLVNRLELAISTLENMPAEQDNLLEKPGGGTSESVVRGDLEVALVHAVSMDGLDGSEPGAGGGALC